MTSASNSTSDTVSETTDAQGVDWNRSVPGSKSAGDPVARTRQALDRPDLPAIRRWRHIVLRRPPVLHLALFLAAYVLGCGFANALAIVPGITVSIWPPGGIFLATLILTNPFSWPWWIAAGCAAEMFAQLVWFHSPLPAGFLIYVGNALCAAVGALIVGRATGRPVRLETLQEVLAFVVLGAGVAPLFSATVGSATLAWFGVKSQTFTAVWPLFWIGDATGILLVAPLVLVIVRYWRSKSKLSAAQLAEAGILGLIFLGVAALSLSGNYLPSPYIILPLLLWGAARFEFRGAAVALSLLALITMALTISGDSQFIGDPESQRQRQVMLQLFLAISAFSALIVAAISRQHQLALLTARHSERGLQQLIDAVPATIWCTTPDGIPNYLNQRATDITGVVLGDLIAADGSRSMADVHPDDREATDAALTRSFRTGTSFVERYRQRRANGPHRWVEGRAEPLRDESGEIAQWYGVSVDIEDMVAAQEKLKQREQELSHLVNMVPNHVWRLTPSGEPTFFNKRMIDFLGMDVPDTHKPGMTRLAAMVEACVHPDDANSFNASLRRSLATGEAFAMRYRLRRTDGVYRWMSSRAEPMRDTSGCIIHWYGMCHDVDDQMHAEEALRRSERQLQLMIDAIPVRIWSAVPSDGPVYFNKQFRDRFRSVVTGFRGQGEKSIEHLLQKLTHPEDGPRVAATLRRCFETGNNATVRFRWLEIEKGYRWVECRIEPRRNQDGVIEEWYGVSLDIDEQMHAQQALRERERELSLLVDMVPAFIARQAPDGELTFFNKRLVDFLGLDVADADKSGMSRVTAMIRTVVHPDDIPTVSENASRGFSTGEPFSNRYRMRRADGEYRWMDGRAEPLRGQDGTIVQWFAVAIDVDDEVRAQQKLYDRERELSQLVDMVPSPLWRLNPRGEPVFFSKALIEFLGQDVGDYKGRGKALAAAISTAIHPDDVADLDEALHKALATGESFSVNYRMRRVDGVFRWVSGRGAPLRDADGRILQWFGICHDIDDQLRVEQILRERERSLRGLIETLPAMVECTGSNGDPVYRSEQLREFLGYELEEPDGSGEAHPTRTLGAAVHPDDMSQVRDNYERSLSNGTPYAQKHRLRRSDGEYRWVETRAAPMRDTDGSIVQWNVICLDIDSEVRAQEELRLAREGLAQAFQAASLAELSASIAHEVNQPLAAIVANSHTCQRWLMAKPPNLDRAQKTVERIAHNANAAADVVSRIRALFKRSLETDTSATPDVIIAEAQNLMAEEAARRRVRVEVDVENNLKLVPMDRVQIQQVVINLMRNGIEAMASTPPPRVLGLSVRSIEDTIRIAVSDLGKGVDFPDRIFDPFFTTKEDGMGMGLAICRSIVEAHGGRLWAEKNDRQGTTFFFTLPVGGEPVA
ncbi:PAS domain-containing protein [Ensifer canadensis]